MPQHLYNWVRKRQLLPEELLRRMSSVAQNCTPSTCQRADIAIIGSHNYVWQGVYFQL